MNIEFWIGAGAVVIIAVIFRLIEKRRLLQSSEYSQLRADRRNQVYEIITHVLQAQAAKRVLILYTENGGGEPRAGAHLFFSVLYEDLVPPFSSVLRRDQRIPVDDMHSEILQVTFEHDNDARGWITRTEDMKPGLYADMHRTDGVAISQSFALMKTPVRHYYVIFSTDAESESRLTAPAGQVMIRTAAARLREFFRNNVKE